MPDTVASLYEQLFPLTTVMKQRFVEWFTPNMHYSGRWSTGKDAYNSGTPTFAMDDSVDGGFKVTAEASINNSSGAVGSASSYGLNNIRQFAHNGSVYIDVFKQNTVSSGHKVIAHGLKETMAGDGAGNNACLWGSGVNMNTNYFMSRTCGSSGSQSDTVSDVAYDQNWHNYKIETKSASVEFTLDGVLKTTITTNLPASKMAPTNGVQGTSDSTAPSYSIKYVECYNT